MRRIVLGGLCALALALGVVPVAQAAPEDPIFIYRPLPPPSPPSGTLPPSPSPPPSSTLEGPCGLTVDEVGYLYLSDYHHHVVDLFDPVNLIASPPPPKPAYLGQLTTVDPLDGPCALAMDGLSRLFVNDYHRNVVRFTVFPFDAGTVIDGAPLNAEHPTGVAVDPATNYVYVDERTRIAVFDSSGTKLGTIGEGSLQDGYGLAYSQGNVYVPDAATETIEVYEATPGETDPVAEIDGSGIPNGHFTSLRDAAIAVDDTSGEIYVADNLQPETTEQPETVIWVFDSAGAYKGRLKYSVVAGPPVGLAVDNTAGDTQGRVYVTSGNTEGASLYGYRPGAATANGVPLPPPPVGAGGGAGVGAGSGSLAASAPAAAVAPAVALESASASPATKRRHHHKPKRHHRGKAHR